MSYWALFCTFWFSHHTQRWSHLLFHLTQFWIISCCPMSRMLCFALCIALLSFDWLTLDVASCNLRSEMLCIRTDMSRLTFFSSSEIDFKWRHFRGWRLCTAKVRWHKLTLARHNLEAQTMWATCSRLPLGCWSGHNQIVKLRMTPGPGPCTHQH